MKKMPEPENTVVPQYRIEVINTGDRYITLQEARSRRYRNIWHGDEKIESVEFSIGSSDPEFGAILELIKVSERQRKKIAELEGKITSFNSARENLKI